MEKLIDDYILNDHTHIPCNAALSYIHSDNNSVVVVTWSGHMVLLCLRYNVKGIVLFVFDVPIPQQVYSRNDFALLTH